MPGRGRPARTLLWDFDGTLGYRLGGRWSGALLEVIARAAPGAAVTAAQLQPYLQTSFPWLAPDRPHPGIRSAGEWWRALQPVFEAAFAGVGFAPPRARSMAHQVRAIYTDVARWRLFDDALPALAALSSLGWSHAILSNHVPELRHIAAALGLAPYLDRIWNSAETGYEKPHPRAFQMVLEGLDGPGAVWMIGDDPRADVAGARAAGIPAILVRSADPGAEYACDSLHGVAAIVGRGIVTEEGS
jgi:putative hydrolase of the HAD superfamily